VDIVGAKKNTFTPTMPVYIDKSTRHKKKWRAEINTKGFRKKLGRYATETEARKALEEAKYGQMKLF
jgi:hypothetical protein